MFVDHEHKQLLLKKYNELAQTAVAGLVSGAFASLSDVERQRGIIVGIGLCIDVLEDKKEPQQQVEEEDVTEG